jgi:hypothetical protein
MAGPKRFPSLVAEKLGYYVYALKDPRDGEVFYIGKGKNDRVFSHMAAAAKTGHRWDGIPNPKLERIYEIQDRGNEVAVEIMRHGLTEREALEVEAALIDFYGLNDLLGNLVNGHGKERGRMSAEDVIALYGARRAPKFPKALKAVLLKIPVLWYPSMPPSELYKATRGDWVAAGPRIKNVEYAFAVNRGVIREAYKVHDWHLSPSAKTSTKRGSSRYEFDGTVVDDDPDITRFRNKDVSHLYKPGAANPLRYVNC